MCLYIDYKSLQKDPSRQASIIEHNCSQQTCFRIWNVSESIHKYENGYENGLTHGFTIPPIADAIEPSSPNKAP